MVLENKDNSQIVFGGKIIETSIDVEDLAHIKSALSGKIYSNKYSFIVENIQNACDIHKQVNSDKKVKVGFETDNNGRYIYFQDWGTGIDPLLMDNVVSKFGKSTKRNSNDYDGAFGIGFFSNLAFTDNCFIITVVDNIKYTYILSNNNGAEFILSNTADTDEPNSTIIKVYIPGGYYELKELKDELKKLSSYFEGVDCSEFQYPLIKNNLFYFSQDFTGDNNIHISYGKGYYYEIPWKSLGMKPIPIKVAIPFKTGELKPTLNREALQLEKHHLELIETRILELMAYFKSNVKYEFDNFDDFMEAHRNGSIEFVKGLNISYSDLGIKNVVFTPLKEIKPLDLLHDLSWGRVNKTKIDFKKYNHDYYNKYNKQLLICDKNYLNTKYFRQFVDGKKVIELPTLSLGYWKRELRLKDIPKTEWRRIINTYIDWFKTEFKVTTFTEIKESQEFLDYVVKERAKIQKNYSVKRDSITWIARWNLNKGYKVIWDSELSENSGEKIYVTNKTPKDKIEFLMSLISHTNMQMIKAKEENYEFIEEDNIVATVYYSLIIKKFLKENDHWFNIAKTCLGKEENESFKKLENFNYKHDVKISSEINGFTDSLLKLIELHGLTDPISEELVKVKQLIEKYPYFNWMEYEYYRKEKTINFHNYIQNLSK